MPHRPNPPAASTMPSWSNPAKAVAALSKHLFMESLLPRGKVRTRASANQIYFHLHDQDSAPNVRFLIFTVSENLMNTVRVDVPDQT